MKTTKKIEAKARQIARLVAELRDDVIKAEDSQISDVYRGYIITTEAEVIDRYLEFANRLDFSIQDAQ